jgi:hypothetical protein
MVSSDWFTTPRDGFVICRARVWSSSGRSRGTPAGFAVVQLCATVLALSCGTTTGWPFDSRGTVPIRGVRVVAGPLIQMNGSDRNWARYFG